MNTSNKASTPAPVNRLDRSSRRLDPNLLTTVTPTHTEPPQKKRPTIKVTDLLSRHRKRTLLVGSLVLVLTVGIFITTYNQSSDQHSDDQDTSYSPRYQTVIPSGKSIDNLGGWKRVSPPDSAPVFAYNDIVDETGIIVSQQPLPQDFQSNTNKKVADLAKGYQATSKFTTGGITVYHGLSAQGPQSLIFTKDNLLVFIKSEQKLDDETWKQYISSLNIQSSTSETNY